MPRIADQFLNCAVYLYRSVDDAIKGERRGGTGFLVRIASKVQPNAGYVYAVTNAHVVKGGANVIRLNAAPGKAEPLELLHNWICDPSGSDLALCMIRLNLDSNPQISCVSSDDFLTKQIMSEYNLGAGDETFMVGRFINHEGTQTNMPAVRLGNIAMVPREPISHNGHEEESFLVEVRSIGGYSGSPVSLTFLPFRCVLHTSRSQQMLLDLGYLA